MKKTRFGDGVGKVRVGTGMGLGVGVGLEGSNADRSLLVYFIFPFFLASSKLSLHFFF